MIIKKAKQPKMANGGAVKCWPGYEKQGSKVGKSGKTVNNCVKKAKDGGKFSYARELASLKGRIKKTMKDGGSTPAWTRKEGKNPSGGLNAKGRASYNAANPGSNLKAPQPEGGPRKKSFCARMSGVKGPMKKPNGEPTRKALALRKWKC